MRNSTSRYIALLDFPQTCEGRGTGMHRQFVTSSFIPPFFKLSFWVGLSDFPPSPFLPPFSGTASVNRRFKWKEAFSPPCQIEKGTIRNTALSCLLDCRLVLDLSYSIALHISVGWDEQLYSYSLHSTYDVCMNCSRCSGLNSLH